MKKLYYYLALFFGGIMILSAFSNNPPNGRTGAPGDGLCTDCHAPSNPSQNGTITVNGFPESITANEVYPLQVVLKVTEGAAMLAGFQMTIQGTDNVGLGSMTNASENTVVTDANGKQYFEHNPAGAITDSMVWTVDWTAPVAMDGTAAMYYAAGNLANGNGANSGDRIVTTNGSGTFGMLSSSRNVAEVNVEIYPNPSQDFVNIKLEDQSLIHQVNILSMSGQVMITQKSTDYQVDISNLNAGMYIIQVETSTGLYISKVVKG